VSHIFLSYNREDRAAALHFVSALEAMGHQVWWDGGLRVGESYDEVTEAALRRAAAVVVLWSPRSVGSRWVRAEATIAQKLGTLFPVMIEACDRPVMFELIQTADLAGWAGTPKHPAFQAFSADLEAFIALRATSEQPVTAPAKVFVQSSSAKFDRRTLVLTGVGLVGAIGIGATGLMVVKGRTTKPSTQSLAILPFKNISGSPEQDYFSEGLSAELRAALTRNPELQVAATTSSRQVSRDDLDVSAMAQKLKVAFILQGSVSKAGNTIRVAADLTDAAAGVTKWSDTFERSLADVFAVQSEIASKVAAALATKITGTSGGNGASNPAIAGSPNTIGGSSNVAAFEAFLHGREVLGLATDMESDRRALTWFDQAIEIDSGFAAAHAWRARTLSALSAQSSNTQEMKRDRDSAIAAARTAIRLAPDYPSGYVTLGWVLFNQALDVKGARVAFDKARALSPGDADVLMAAAIFNARTQKITEARSDIAHALILDPLNPYAFRVAGTVSLIAGDYARALSAYDRAMALNPTGSIIQALRGEAFCAQERWSEARDAYEREPIEMFKKQGLAIVHWKLGNKAAAQSAFGALQVAGGENTQYQQAQVLAQWGQLDNALDALEKAYENLDPGLAQMQTDLFLITLRYAPRFRALQRAIGFVT
jgi:TolB-like protein/tetratricopeptide (TPR) repeat protein